VKPPHKLSRRDFPGAMSPRKIVRLIGGGLVVLPAVIVASFLVMDPGWGSGKDYQPGMKLARFISLILPSFFDSAAAIAALVVIGVGLVVLAASVFVPD
jgi:hypothetical protein